MVEITSRIEIDEDQLDFEFIHAGGPGGQKVNKTASAVRLRFHPNRFPQISSEVRNRLFRLAGSRSAADGSIIIEARCYRCRQRNRLDAVERLVGLIRQALVVPRLRRKTRPSRAAKQRRLESKKKLSEKKMRRKAGED